MTPYTIDKNIHHALGIQLNNLTWSLLVKEERTPEDDFKMITYAYGSQYHWSISPKWMPINEQRGEWLLSHVFAVLGNGEKALKHAQTCLALTEKNKYTGFDRAYAFEAMARAFAAIEDGEQAKVYFEKAEIAGNDISGEEDKKLFFSDLNAPPWYGVKE